MFCPNCGKQLPDGVRFCTGCGTALTRAVPAPDPEPAPEPAWREEPPRKKKTGLIVGLIVAVAAASLGAFIIAPRLASGGSRTGDAGTGVSQTAAEADSAGGEVEYTLDDLLYDGTLPEVYAAPAELGNVPASFCFELDGVLYQMPVPVSVFEAGGWELESAGRLDLPRQLEGKQFYPAALKKGDEMCRVELWNPSEGSMAAKECDVVELTAADGDGLSIVVPEGIALGMDRQTLDGIIGSSETTYYYEDSAGGRTFTVYPNDDRGDTDCVQITCDDTAGAVTEIRLRNEMRPGLYPTRALGEPEHLDQETMVGPCYAFYSGLWDLESWQSIVDYGLPLADLVLGMDQSAIDPDIFEASEDDPNRYSMRLDELYGGYHFLLGGKIIAVNLVCQDAHVASVEFSMGFGHGEVLGRGQAVTAEEYTALAEQAVAAFGNGYEHTSSDGSDAEGLPEEFAGVIALVGATDTYDWPTVRLTYRANWGYASITFHP